MARREDSVEFIERQINDNYSAIMKKHLMERMYWIEDGEEARGVAILHEIIDDKIYNNNLICLFPPFIE